MGRDNVSLPPRSPAQIKDKAESALPSSSPPPLEDCGVPADQGETGEQAV